jgi:exoribonuclease R
LRQRIEAERGGVSLDLPSQRVSLEADGYHLEHEHVVAAMGWNAQISLLTGMVAGATMLHADLGVLRTLPPPPEQVVAQVRAAAGALGVDWPAGATYQDVVRGLDSDVPGQAALLVMAARGLRGAGYLALTPGTTAPTKRAVVQHAAVAAPYAHVTAPLRRLVDRYATEVCIGLLGGPAAPPEIVDRLADLPKTMAHTKGREGSAGRAAIDLVEALLLASHIGAEFEATVVAEDKGRSKVVIPDPAIETEMEGNLPLGQVVPVRVVATDPIARTIDLDPVR